MDNYKIKVKDEAESKKDQGLISGDEALRALADGKEVEYFSPEYSKEWKSIRDLTIGFDIGHFLNDDHDDESYKFRLKPQTIRLELELPKPFEPKKGDEYFYISTLQHCLYSHDVWSDEPADITQAAFGAYRTEEDVKKAVEQLGKIRGTNS